MSRKSADRIYATGVFLVPVKLPDNWVWMVDSFEDDSYKDGELVDVREFAEKQEDLIIKELEYELYGKEL